MPSPLLGTRVYFCVMSIFKLNINSLLLRAGIAWLRDLQERVEIEGRVVAEVVGNQTCQPATAGWRNVA
jgi:hypothetical protein